MQQQQTEEGEAEKENNRTTHYLSALNLLVVLKITARQLFTILDSSYCSNHEFVVPWNEIYIYK